MEVGGEAEEDTGVEEEGEGNLIGLKNAKGAKIQVKMIFQNLRIRMQ